MCEIMFLYFFPCTWATIHNNVKNPRIGQIHFLLYEQILDMFFMQSRMKGGLVTLYSALCVNSIISFTNSAFTFFGCGLTCSLTLLKRSKVVSVALASSKQKVFAFADACIEIESSFPGIAGALVTRQGALVCGAGGAGSPQCCEGQGKCSMNHICSGKLI